MSILIKDLNYSIQGKPILININLEIYPGKVLTILGPNGAGKSSLIKLISGDTDPTAGKIYYDNLDLKLLSLELRAEIRAVMSQSQLISFDYTVQEIIEMGWLNRGLSNYSKDFDEAIQKIAIECSVENHLEQRFNTLSGGEKRRVHFARTLIQLWRPSGSLEPRYMFLDEPTANLDILHEQKMMKLIEKKKNEGIGVLLILHDLNLAAKYSNRIAIFSNGELVDIGKPKTVLTDKTLSSIYGLEMKIDKNPFRINYY